MPNPVHRPEYEVFRAMLVRAREESRLTQVEVAAALARPQSFVSKFERGERRLDFTEFVEISAVMGIDFDRFLADYRRAIGRLPKVRRGARRKS